MIPACVRGFLEVQEPDRRIPMDLQAKLDAAPGTETHFTSLDRTDPETGHVFLGFEM